MTYEEKIYLNGANNARYEITMNLIREGAPIDDTAKLTGLGENELVDFLKEQSKFIKYTAQNIDSVLEVYECKQKGIYNFKELCRQAVPFDTFNIDDIINESNNVVKCIIILREKGHSLKEISEILGINKNIIK